ncbi:uncharacterized protein si:dkeyp-113d7.10 isoform X2 [Syngnathoides biaculeatus]|uniref:uncharacterized protein si:dkeyp-113d7.10 isoform X2 n=1 Tax=Syngnathoides biaculeatus TaxID=300417 RepID=UPI002ADE2086|nr:uncharacterized protein si:dkeyp-113d7.10 isoform X2 [Syngnathoides biaculeatus]XP_061702381.1 uncharacterized protein si:dkeyp-113d7.10 isoform X2 [Syngnathoides biaculeatus]XP_061702382.1 uncharacterized protein si:dkeyp-113d7.10 isoform X2 [Syngnathoides biaculeatus]XP_061702383.1 uncharacterized protein si:dkeyp-113d7.10 isoform X2 [Syngnathoides biaculeatus]
MNGAVYIPFFQGQLESVLEQVVQLAVQEISSTVGSSLNALLLEAAVHERENRRLRLRLQACETRRARGDDSPDDAAGTKPERPSQQPRAPTDGRRLEQRGRVVEQLKCAVERVLHSALCQLKKMVEASFDDLLLEITQKECERQRLQARLDRRRVAARREARDEAGEDGTGAVADEEDAAASGHQWCADVWEVKGSPGGGGESEAPALSLGSPPPPEPRWTPLEDMDVLSPDRDAGPPPASPLNPSGSGGAGSSASMLQRLLTASQLPDDHAGAAHEKPREDEEGEGEEEEEDGPGKKAKRRKVRSECEDCGRGFGRAPPLKARGPTRGDEDVSPRRCSRCGRRFSSARRLRGRSRAQHRS